MKTPIQPSDIRKGDLIRWESGTSEHASEYRAQADKERRFGGNHYLLDRPAPAVELPTVPTQEGGYIHGYLEFHNGAQVSVKRSPNGLWWWEALPVSGPTHLTNGSWDALLDHMGRTATLTFVRLVAEATGTTAVPTEALDALRKQRQAWPLGVILNNDQLAIRHFLEAIDKAAQR